MKYKVLLFFFISIACIYLNKKQYFNWDIEAYMGLVYQLDNPTADIKKVHTSVYEELRVVEPKKFEFDLYEEDETEGAKTYYKILAENPKAYGEELNLFVVKPLYTIVSYLLYKAGFALSTSVYMISIISFVLIVILVFTFLSELLRNEKLALVFTLFFTLFSPVLHSARHSTPDMLSCLLLLLGFFILFKHKSIFWFTIIAMLNICTRPDYIIFYGLFYAGIFLYTKIKKSKFQLYEIILGLVFVCTTFLLVNSLTQIPWKILVMNQFLKVQIYPISNPDIFVWSDYLNFVKSKIMLEFNGSYFPIFIFFFSILILLQKADKKLV